MLKVRHSRLQAIKWSTFTMVSSMLFMLTFVLLVLLGLGIFSLRSSSEGFFPSDPSSYRRMTSEREGDRMEKKEEKWTEILSWEPRAFLYHNFLSKEEREYLITLAKPHMVKSTVVDAETGRSTESRVRKSTGSLDRVIRDIEKRIADFSFIPSMERNFKFSTMIGQKYETHTDDYFVDEFITKTGGQRTATLLLYLSDVEEGGETVFPYADVNISSVPWWNELSECAKQGLSLNQKGQCIAFLEHKT